MSGHGEEEWVQCIFGSMSFTGGGYLVPGPWGVVSLVPGPLGGGVGIPDPRPLPGEWVCPGWVRTNTPGLLTPGGDCHTHGRQAGGTHPTGTLTCF